MLEVVSAELPIVEVRFILPLEDFPEGDNIETFSGFLADSNYVIYKSAYRELYLVKVKPSDTEGVYIANGPSLLIGQLKYGQRVKPLVNDLVNRLVCMSAFELVTNVLMKEPISVELNLTSGIN